MSYATWVELIHEFGYIIVRKKKKKLQNIIHLYKLRTWALPEDKGKGIMTKRTTKRKVLILCSIWQYCICKDICVLLFLFLWEAKVTYKCLGKEMKIGDPPFKLGLLREVLLSWCTPPNNNRVMMKCNNLS
jgi:hypothetical protein